MSETEYSYQNKVFVIKNYNKSKTFSNFLPGLAGKRGIPLWAFYVNRTQLISGFGLNNKNHPIMLFHSANKAYETVATSGFRTFIKCNGLVYEAFNIHNEYEHQMEIEPSSVTIREINSDLNISVEVSYFGLPNEMFPALTRVVNIKNIGDSPVDIEILDGLAELLPAGVRTEEFKSLSNLLQSWMDVDCLADSFGFYKLRGSTGDKAEVKEVKEGNFYLGFDDFGLIRPIADADIIFGYDTSKSKPLALVEKTLRELVQEEQVTKNKVPCAFLPIEKTLKKGAEYEFYALIGHTYSLEALKDNIERLSKSGYVHNKRIEAKEILDDLLKDVESTSGKKTFDAYIKQCYLDNLLRGGYPIEIGQQIFHIYARKHGDLERDYNFFSLAPEYYSTGPGNFRDVCQNRRVDSMIHPEVKWFNVYQFGNLIQIDGYNPLSVNGVSYKIDEKLKDEIIQQHFQDSSDLINGFFNKRFSPGDLVNFVERNNILVKTSEKEYLDAIIRNSDLKVEASFAEGYWIDHFTYFLDLVEGYLAIYPDSFEELYYNKEIFMYYSSPIKVLKQSQKSVLLDDLRVRQYKSIEHLNRDGDYLKIGNSYYKSTLFVKLLILALNKFVLLDPEGLGVEMEAGKPGWNDAMNGLPGLFGSGVSEAIELKRIIDFLIAHKKHTDVLLPEEVKFLIDGLKQGFDYNHRVSLREEFRDKVENGLGGQVLDNEEIFELLKEMSSLLEQSINKLFDEFDGIIPTYLTYEVIDYLVVEGEHHNGYPLVKPISFKRNTVSAFLEAPARLLKTDFSKDKLLFMYNQIRKTEMYDKGLAQYKTSVKLENDSYEIGRVKAFTPGWLERESNFLHMTYKYLLGLLKSKLYEEFFKELNNNFVCFMNPKVYGRSILENSSFIASTNNPNPKIHGQGFFARLSGSTVEALNIWLVMMVGDKPFKFEENQLVFEPKPVIDKTFFTQDGELSFRFMKSTMITYHNKEMLNTYCEGFIDEYLLISHDDRRIVVRDLTVRGKLAEEIRLGNFKEIHIYIKNKNGGKL